MLRALQALSSSGAEVGVCISDAGCRSAPELYGDMSLAREEVTDGSPSKAWTASPWSGCATTRSPYASGSARVNGYVVCPCSMSTAASIAAGAMANPVHRAASVALKEERKLVLVPRETPLSTIHLENLLRLRRAGATVVAAAPGFYHAPKPIDDLVNFVVARCLDQLEIDQTLVSRWGQ